VHVYVHVIPSPPLPSPFPSTSPPFFFALLLSAKRSGRHSTVHIKLVRLPIDRDSHSPAAAKNVGRKTKTLFSRAPSTSAGWEHYGLVSSSSGVRHTPDIRYVEFVYLSFSSVTLQGLVHYRNSLLWIFVLSRAQGNRASSLKLELLRTSQRWIGTELHA
jgi:hypothetical protein